MLTKEAIKYLSYLVSAEEGCAVRLRDANRILEDARNDAAANKQMHEKAAEELQRALDGN